MAFLCALLCLFSASSHFLTHLSLDIVLPGLSTSRLVCTVSEQCCMQVAPLYAALAAERPDAIFAEVDVDENPVGVHFGCPAPVAVGAPSRKGHFFTRVLLALTACRLQASQQSVSSAVGAGGCCQCGGDADLPGVCRWQAGTQGFACLGDDLLLLSCTLWSPGTIALTVLQTQP